MKFATMSPAKVHLRSMFRVFWGILSLVIILQGFTATAQVDWPTVGFSQAVTNIFLRPTCIAHASDGNGRLFIAEQAGRIWIVQSNAVIAQPFLDITNRVQSAGSEQGLLGIAFPPTFPTNNYFYVSYTIATSNSLVVSRFHLTADPNVADTNSEEQILVVQKPYNNHNGGQIAFGPDGYLYVGIGDGGSETDPKNYGQTTTTLLGKILRIDVEGGTAPYGVPADNPFVGNPAYAPEIWAYGLRNPWRFSFDRLTGDLYIGDVGQNRFEEIDFQAAGSHGGQNYGWRIMEGSTNYNVPSGFTNFADLTLPVVSYDHLALPTDAAGCVIGGYVCRASQQTRLNGIYFYADFAAGWMWGLKQTGTNWQSLNLLGPPVGIHIRFSSFGEDDQGNLYFSDYSGRIYLIQDTGLVCTPAFSVASGSTLRSNFVTVTCASPGASIHYTTNGIDPTENDPGVSSGETIAVSYGVTNKLRAFRSDLAPSAVVSAVYKLQAGDPAFSPLGGLFTNNVQVTLTSVTPNATIYYALGGVVPTTNSSVYTAPLVFTGTATIKALATAAGYSNSFVRTASYTLAQVAVPIFTPPAGPITNGTSISISCATAGATIYYTVNGTTPTTLSYVYSAPVAITGDTTLNAMAAESGYASSSVTSVFYARVKAATPVFAPSAGPLTNGASISISTVTPDAVLYYTTNGSDPTTNSVLYSGPLVFTEPVTLTARAFRGDLDASDAATTYFPLLSQDDTVVTTVAGQVNAGLVNGIGIDAQFSSPEAICLDGFGNLYVADSGNNVIRKISPSAEVMTYAGTGIAGSQLGAATNAQFDFPTGVCVDSIGNVFIAEQRNCSRILKIDTNATVSLVCTLFPPSYCVQNQLQFLEIDSGGTLYTCLEAAIEQIFPNGAASRFAGPGSCCGTGWGTQSSGGVGIDASRNVYASTFEHYYNAISRIYKIQPDGTTDLFAGDSPLFSDGPRLLARFESPQDIVVDGPGNIFVADATRVRKIRGDGWVSTYAGSEVSGYLNGSGAQAQFSNAYGLCADTQGNIYVADTGNNCIRKISPKPAAPSMKALLKGQKLVISWPVWADSYVLESTTTVSGGGWSPTGDVVSEDVNQFSVTNDVDVNIRYYRLHQN